MYKHVWLALWGLQGAMALKNLVKNHFKPLQQPGMWATCAGPYSRLACLELMLRMVACTVGLKVRVLQDCCLACQVDATRYRLCHSVCFHLLIRRLGDDSRADIHHVNLSFKVIESAQQWLVEERGSCACLWSQPGQQAHACLQSLCCVHSF